jgi:hypothetical protein
MLPCCLEASTVGCILSLRIRQCSPLPETLLFVVESSCRLCSIVLFVAVALSIPLSSFAKSERGADHGIDSSLSMREGTYHIEPQKARGREKGLIPRGGL